MIVAAILIYLVCSILTYGIALADMQNIWKDRPEWRDEEYPHRRKFALFMSLYGPAGLIVGLICADNYCLQYRRIAVPSKSRR